MSAAGQEQWQPLLRPSLLETLWQKLVCLWQSLGFIPAAASATTQPSFANYVQSGSYPDQHGKQPQEYCNILMSKPICHPVGGAWSHTEAFPCLVLGLAMLASGTCGFAATTASSMTGHEKA